MRIFKCDKCGKESKDFNNFVMVKVYEKSQKQGGKSKGYHLCKKCSQNFLGKNKNGN